MQSNNLSDFTSTINFFYSKFTNKELNHFEVLGISTSATHREIRSAYDKNNEIFTTDKITTVTDPETKKKAAFVIERINHAYEVLIDYDKKARYEKLGFRDEPEEKEETDEEKARLYYKKAKSLYAQKKFRYTCTAMEEAIKLDDKKAEYFLLLGLAQTNEPAFKRDAEKSLNTAISMEPWNAEPVVAMGMLFYSERLFAKAEPFFRKAVQLDNNHTLAKNKLEEIAPSSKFSIGEIAKDVLGKALPSLFGKKKK